MFTIAITVTFNQSTYSVDEDNGLVQPVLILSNPSSTDITVQVITDDNTATGEWTNIALTNNMVIVIILQKKMIMILDHMM